MKQLEKILGTVCVITTAGYFLSAMLLVLGQAGALFMLDGELCAAIFNTVKVPAGYAAASTAILAFILSYLRGEMTAEKD